VIHKRKISIIEDDPNDQYLLQLAWQATGTKNLIQCVSGGREGIRYLRAKENIPTVPVSANSSFIITDLKMSEGGGVSLFVLPETFSEMGRHSNVSAQRLMNNPRMR
jgi:hypothetical protein